MDSNGLIGGSVVITDKTVRQVLKGKSAGVNFTELCRAARRALKIDPKQRIRISETLSEMLETGELHLGRKAGKGSYSVQNYTLNGEGKERANGKSASD